MARRPSLLATLALLAACSSPAPAPSPAGHADLPNVHRLDDRIISGGVPTGDAAFDGLAALGVRTIISVDGMTPDVARAQARGMRYVHIPITYAEVSEAETLELARAIRDLPGPVYVHCHHGKHRSPAAAAAAAIALGRLTPEEGVAFMREAGTAASYEGLYACVAAGHAATPIQLDAAPADFPSVRRPEGLVAAMLEADAALELLARIRAAGWAVPAEHPDLVPAAEAGRLADDLRLAGEDPDARAHGEDFLARLAAASDAAAELEAALVARADAATLEGLYRPVSASCRDCHARHRDRR